jgi:hypothetical protein
MATQSYPRPAPDIEPPALEIRWIAQGGRLQSHWSIAPQFRQMRPGWLERERNSRSVTHCLPGFKVHSFRILHLVCWLLVLLF